MVVPDESAWPVVAGTRCQLRVLRLADVDAWRAGDDAEQQRWFNAPGPAPRENVVRAITAWRRQWETSGPTRQWGIWSGGALAGGVEISDRGAQRANLSYVVFPQYRRRGLATEAVTMAVEWGLSQLPVSAVVAVIDELNTASIEVVTRAGFVFDGPADPGEASEPGSMMRYLRLAG